MSCWRYRRARRAAHSRAPLSLPPHTLPVEDRCILYLNEFCRCPPGPAGLRISVRKPRLQPASKQTAPRSNSQQDPRNAFMVLWLAVVKPTQPLQLSLRLLLLSGGGTGIFTLYKRAARYSDCSNRFNNQPVSCSETTALKCVLCVCVCHPAGSWSHGFFSL